VTRARLVHWLPMVALLAALLLVMESEYRLAIAVGWPPWVAWCAPLALDSYVVWSVLAHKDLRWSVAISAVSVIASHYVYAAPGAWHGVPPADASTGLVPPLAALCSVVPLLVAWRIHNIDQKVRRPSTINPGARKTTPAQADTSTPDVPGISTSSATGSGLVLAAGRSSGGGPRKTRDEVKVVAVRMRDDLGDWPPYRRLALEAGCARGTAEKVLRELKEAA
jgi:hypothetical protein